MSASPGRLASTSSAQDVSDGWSAHSHAAEGPRRRGRKEPDAESSSIEGAPVNAVERPLRLTRGGAYVGVRPRVQQQDERAVGLVGAAFISAVSQHVPPLATAQICI